MIFDQITGHEKTIKRLKTALKRRPLNTSSLLFCGPSGVGKKLTSLGWAQGVLCQETSAPCGKCSTCLRVASKSHPDLLVIEPGENTSLKIEQIRDAQNFVSLKAFEGHAKVVIIDEAHLMTLQAANALLKTLEEPPPQSHFILVTSNRGALIPTVQSRCQCVLFGSLEASELKKIVPAVESWVFELAQGRVDLALRLGDEGYKKLRAQAVKLLGGLGLFRLYEGFTLMAELSGERESALFTLHCWEQIFRNAAAQKLGAAISHAPTLDEKEAVESLKNNFSQKTLLTLGQKVLKLEQDILSNVNRGLAFEQFFIEASNLKGI